jgi:predicted nucleic acid-binding protein
MIILDTNVLSELMQAAPERRVLAWVDTQPRSSIWTSAITIMEIRYGLQILPGGRRRSVLLQGLEIALRRKIEDRIVPFDSTAAVHAGDIMAERQRKGRPIEIRDTMIAGIALATHATLATRNVADFEDLSIPVVNPWAS